jgi:hypothetical protein
MEVVSRRPLSAQERRDLARLSSNKDALTNDIVSTACAFMLVFGAGTLLVRCVSGPPEGATLAVVAAVAAGLALWALVTVKRRSGSFLARERALLAQDLAGGHALATTYTVVDALRVEEAEDEGSSYYLRLADGRVLYLSGQYLYEYEEGGAFPCTRFTVVRAPASGMFLEMLALGPPLAPSGTLPPFTTVDHRADRVPSDGDVLTLDFESLRAKVAG